MNQAIVQYTKSKGRMSRRTDAVEEAKQRHADECQLRIARRMNGADPEFKNGPTPTFPATR